MSDVINSKFRKGLKFRTHLYVDNAGCKWLFADQPSCPKEVARWEERAKIRSTMTDQERLQDSIKEHFDGEPRKGYNPSCDCDVCKNAHLARYFKGLAGSPSAASLSSGEVDPRFTLASCKERFNKFIDTCKSLPPSEVTQLSQAVSALRASTGGAWVFDLPTSKFEAIIFKLVRELWVEDVTAKRFYGVDTDQAKYINRHQPDWCALHGIDEVAEVQKDPVLSPDLCAHRVVAINAIGPFTEAQAMLVFGTIRSISSKGGVVVVNTDDTTLRGYVMRLKKHLE